MWVIAMANSGSKGIFMLHVGGLQRIAAMLILTIFFNSPVGRNRILLHLGGFTSLHGTHQYGM